MSPVVFGRLIKLRPEKSRRFCYRADRILKIIRYVVTSSARPRLQSITPNFNRMSTGTSPAAKSHQAAVNSIELRRPHAMWSRCNVAPRTDVNRLKNVNSFYGDRPTTEEDRRGLCWTTDPCIAWPCLVINPARTMVHGCSHDLRLIRLTISVNSNLSVLRSLCAVRSTDDRGWFSEAYTF